MTDKPILYCHCAYARAIPKSVKNQVLSDLIQHQVSFEAVPDLCKLSAEKNPALQKYSQNPQMNIVACYPRAVKWLFAAANAPLDKQIKIHNMRTQEAQEIVSDLVDDE